MWAIVGKIEEISKLALLKGKLPLYGKVLTDRAECEQASSERLKLPDDRICYVAVRWVKNLPSGKPDTFSVDGVKVWVKLDFACPEDDGSIRVIDWKSGNSKEEPDPTQLNIYGYFASEVWDIPEEKIHLTAYNVNQDKQYDRTFSEEGKQEIREKILNSVQNMKEMLTDKEANETEEEDFPKEENDNFCRHCRYRGVCKPELVE